MPWLAHTDACDDFLFQVRVVTQVVREEKNFPRHHDGTRDSFDCRVPQTLWYEWIWADSCVRELSVEAFAYGGIVLWISAALVRSNGYVDPHNADCNQFHRHVQ